MSLHIDAPYTGKAVVITGASRGIGEATAIAFAQAGVSGLALLSRSDMTEVKQACLDAQRPDHTLKVLTLTVDVTILEQVSEAVKRVEEEFGRLDVVVNNAGYADAYVTFADADPKDWWKAWEVNVEGTFNVTHSFLPLLIKDGGDKTIINVSSIVAFWNWQYCSSYVLAKMAVPRFTELIMAEYGDKFAIQSSCPRTAMCDILPEEHQKRLIDTLHLPAHTFIWLAREKKDWLAGRYISAYWDMEELSAKEEIVNYDELKLKMAV